MDESFPHHKTPHVPYGNTPLDVQEAPATMPARPDKNAAHQIPGQMNLT